MGGPVAGAVAGLIMAVSAAAVDQSTFIWNPNIDRADERARLCRRVAGLVDASTALVVLAAVGTALTVQATSSGVDVVPVIGALFVADCAGRRAGRGGAAVLTAGLVGLGAAALTYLPLIVNELSSAEFGDAGAAGLPAWRWRHR